MKFMLTPTLADAALRYGLFRADQFEVVKPLPVEQMRVATGPAPQTGKDGRRERRRIARAAAKQKRKEL